MIDKALETLKNQIHQYLKSLPDLSVGNADTIELTHVVKEDGSVVIPKESLGLTLINIEEERIHKEQIALQTSPNGQVMHFNPEIKLNLFILVAANFNTYSTGLKYLSGAIHFFQAKNVFTPENTPSMDSRIVKLIVDLHTLGMEQQNHLWGYLGGKYLPSVVYKVRLIAVQAGLPQDQMPAIKELEIQGTGK